jgi:hypothetical protein
VYAEKCGIKHHNSWRSAMNKVTEECYELQKLFLGTREVWQIQEGGGREEAWQVEEGGGVAGRGGRRCGR